MRGEPLRLVTHLDRAADARARIYGHELDALLDVAEAMGLRTVPVSAVRLIVDRMLDRDSSMTAATGTRRADKHRWPQKETS